jgi:hypothetical protein
MLTMAEQRKQAAGSASILVVGASWDVTARCGRCWIGGGHTAEWGYPVRSVATSMAVPSSMAISHAYTGTAMTFVSTMSRYVFGAVTTAISTSRWKSFARALERRRLKRNSYSWRYAGKCFGETAP